MVDSKVLWIQTVEAPWQNWLLETCHYTSLKRFVIERSKADMNDISATRMTVRRGRAVKELGQPKETICGTAEGACDAPIG